MKEINIACKANGLANMTTSDVHISNESLASKFIIDFSEITDYPGYNKWCDVVLSNGTSLRYDLGVGIDEIVELDLSYQITVPGVTIITPFLYDGIATKIKFKTDKTLVIYNQPEAGDQEAPERDDFIFDLEKRLQDLEEVPGIGTVNSVKFDVTNPATELAIGEMAWDMDHRTIQVRLSEDVYMQIGQEQPAPFKNHTAEEVDEGVPMYVSGVLGSSHQILVTPLSNDNYDNCKRFIGVTTEVMPPNDVGFIAMAGAVHNVSAGAINSVLYVGDKVLTDIEPVPPLNKVVVGMQGQVDNNAVVFVRPDIRKNLEDLNNIIMESMVLGDVPYWMGTHFIKHNLGPQWIDLLTTMTPAQINPANSKPDYDYTNLGLLFPQNDTSEYVVVKKQIPHGYKQGSNLRFHIHIGQAQDLQAVFKYDYKWINIGDDADVVTKTITLDQYAIVYVDGLLHQILYSSEEIDGTGKKISSIIKGKLYRDDNVYIGDILVTDADFHCQVDAFGSIEEYIKQ